MAQKRLENMDRRPGRGVTRLSWLALSLSLALLCGCAVRFPGGQPTITLVPTLHIVIPPTNTPAPTSTPEPDTATPEPTETPAPSALSTLTPTPSETPTFGPSPTPTRTYTSTRIPTITRTPSRTPTITLTPTITFTPTPPGPDLNLMRPGLLSRVVSPIQIEMNVLTGAEGKVTIELVGEDGRVISRQVQDFGDKAGRRYWAAPELPFEIDAAAETARLQVLIQDEYGRAAALTSVDLVLLQVGRNEINPSLIDEDPYLIRRPEADEVVSGGLLALEGLARPLNDSALYIELIDERGVVLSLKQLNVPAPVGELSHTPFIVEIPYKVSEVTPVRLVIRQEGSRIPGTVALSSQLISLAP